MMNEPGRIERWLRRHPRFTLTWATVVWLTVAADLVTGDWVRAVGYSVGAVGLLLSGLAGLADRRRAAR